MKNKNIVIAILVLIIVGSGAFFAGMKYQQSKSSPTRQFNGTQGRTNGAQGRTGFRPVSGQIINADDKSLTVKLQDGSSKIVILSDKTEINKAATGSKEDLKTGETVMVIGQENTDGSVTAQSIQLNPVLRGGPSQAPQP